jgi:hypothetical protein
MTAPEANLLASDGPYPSSKGARVETHPALGFV